MADGGKGRFGDGFARCGQGLDGEQVAEEAFGVEEAGLGVVVGPEVGDQILAGDRAGVAAGSRHAEDGLGEGAAVFGHQPAGHGWFQGGEGVLEGESR